MGSLEKFLNDLYIESSNKNFYKDSIENPFIKFDFLKILKSSIQGRKKIWQSIGNNIDEDETYYKKLLGLNGKTNDKKETNDDSVLVNTTFTKLEIKNALEPCDQNFLNLEENSFNTEEVTTPFKPREKFKNKLRIQRIEE